MLIFYVSFIKSISHRSDRTLTKCIFCNDWHMLSRFTNAILVLGTDPEYVLLQGCELACFEGGVLHCSRQLHPLLFVNLTTLHDVVGDGRAAVIPGWVPGQEARLVCDFRDIKRSWRARFI